MISKFNLRRGLAVLCVFLFSIAQASADTIEIFVSPAGSDDNSGSIEFPFATLTRARDEVRKHLSGGQQADVNVNLRQGTYDLKETLVLGLQDGSQNSTVSWQGYQDEQAVLSSGVKVTGWQKLADEVVGLPETAVGNVWVADIPEGLDRILTLYHGDRRLSRARTKGFAPSTDIHPRDNRSDTLDRYTLHFPQGAVKNWSNLQDAELLIIPSYPWWMNILSFESVDEENRVARTTIPGTQKLCPMVKYAQRAFPINAWIENVPEGLDAPGRWIVNTLQRKIYYWPVDGNKPGDDIYAPALRELIRVEGVNDQKGNQDQPVTGIHFVNLQFTKADRGVWSDDDAGIQHDWEMVDKDNAMLRFRGAQNCRVDRCRFFNAGGNGVRMDLFAQKIAVENCLFHNLGQSAVMMIGYGPGVKDVNHHNRVFNNHIYDCGEIYWHSQMITAFQSGHNYIGHNYIHHVPRKAICICGVRSHFVSRGDKDRRECAKTIRWDEIGEAKTHEQLLPFLHSRNNIIEYNDIHDVLEKMGDGSAINLSGGGVGNIVRFNYLHDVPALHPSSGIRMDGSQTDTLVEKNVVVNLSVAGISPKSVNTIRNNFVIQVCNRSNSGIVRAMGREGGLSNIERNIFYNVYPDKSFYAYDTLDQYTKEDFSKRTINNNVYFCAGTTLADFPELVAMKNRGGDLDSVFADPLFVDRENRDFTLRRDSPALALGIEQVDISKAGLTSGFPKQWKDDPQDRTQDRTQANH